MRSVTAAVARLQREPTLVETAVLKGCEHSRRRRVATDTAPEVYHTLYPRRVAERLKLLQKIIVIHTYAPHPGSYVIPVSPRYTGIMRRVWARPTRAVSSRCPAMTRTPSSILRTIFSGVQVSRNAIPRARHAAKTRSRAS